MPSRSVSGYGMPLRRMPGPAVGNDNSVEIVPPRVPQETSSSNSNVSTASRRSDAPASPATRLRAVNGGSAEVTG